MAASRPSLQRTCWSKSATRATSPACVGLLIDIVVRPDAELGRALARRVADASRHRGSRPGLDSSRRLAPVEGSSIRRKVLGVCSASCSLDRYSATRDEVMDALWPEFDPADALNSLNQTVYFLRRVFEPDYKEDLSPGYLHHESDVIWLDHELVTSTSRDALSSYGQWRPSPHHGGRRALCRIPSVRSHWTSPTRNGRRTIGRPSIRPTSRSSRRRWYRTPLAGHFERGIGLARRALDLTPEADQIELSLLRLYRLNGSHSAAAEQYSHYAAVMRETLGVEPPCARIRSSWIGKVPY